ncbi:hypothetical protein MANES_06G148850v8 [Manihot esculenta]|uniref:Uncharacterized protein n=1 Tax=Manihot esculenta TaxID=3983 RepID=A0ACB7HLQ5_MANES|nr:hypothetical protein MANES_06G148850v8 [Manihot esculenta]
MLRDEVGLIGMTQCSDAGACRKQMTQCSDAGIFLEQLEKSQGVESSLGQ